MDNTGPPGKRTRLDDNDNVSTTSSEHPIHSNVDAVTALWRSEYDRKSHEKMVLDIKHKELQTKYTDLESGHTQLQQAYQNLLVLYNSQSEHISQLPNQSEITYLKQTIKVMEAGNQRNLKRIADLEKCREADLARRIKETNAFISKIAYLEKSGEVDKARIIQFEKKEEANRQKFEKEKKVIKDMYEQQMKAMKKNYEKESASLRQNSDGMNAKEKNHDGMVISQEKIALEATNIDVQTKQEADCDVRQEEEKALLFLRDHDLPWIEYEKHVSAGILKNLHFVRVRIQKSDGTMASLEEILEKLPTIETFECVLDGRGSIIFKKKAFSKLLKLPPFKNLQKFYLSNIPYGALDVDSFIGFMKKHPSCYFLLSFGNRKSLTAENQIKAIVKKLHDECPSYDKLVIDV